MKNYCLIWFQKRKKKWNFYCRSFNASKMSINSLTKTMLPITVVEESSLYYMYQIVQQLISFFKNLTVLTSIFWNDFCVFFPLILFAIKYNFFSCYQIRYVSSSEIFFKYHFWKFSNLIFALVNFKCRFTEQTSQCPHKFIDKRLWFLWTIQTVDGFQLYNVKFYLYKILFCLFQHMKSIKRFWPQRWHLFFLLQFNYF